MVGTCATGKGKEKYVYLPTKLRTLIELTTKRVDGQQALCLRKSNQRIENTTSKQWGKQKKNFL